MKKILLASVCFSFLIMGDTSSAFAEDHLLDEVPIGMDYFEVSPSILQIVNDALPEETGQIDQNFLNQAYNPNISLSADSQVAITFIDEGAGYQNALGYFSYTDQSFAGQSFGDIDTDNSGIISSSEILNVSGVTADLIFPNASRTGSGGLINQGDTIVLGGGSIDPVGDSWTITDGNVFDAGTNIGFFLVANGWNDYGSVGTVDGWDGTFGDPYTYYSLDFLNPENDPTATIDTVDYSARHVALTFESDDRDTLILGFEDLNRLTNSDDDFNDAVFIVRSDPYYAIEQTEVAVYSAPSPVAGGGLIGFVILMLSGLFRKDGFYFRVYPTQAPN